MRRILQYLLCLFLIVAAGCNSDSGLSDSSQVNHSLFQHHFSSAEFEILEQANDLLNTPPVAITDNPTLRYLHDNRTYVSLACYWWPDPDTDDGLPYIRRDGEVNPETRGDASDLPKLIDMTLRVEILTNAWLISGNEEFSQKAIEQIRTWFVNPDTAMRPHLEHAQMIKGLNRGRSYGVIDTWWLIRVIDAVPILKKSGYWTEETERELKNWFTHYLNWLRNSDFGLQEKQSANNHGTWYDVQVVSFSKFIGQTEYASHHLKRITKPRLSGQIRFTGRQHREVRRPRPEHYSIYNLSGWLKLARMSEESGIRLDEYPGLLAGDLNDAIHYLIGLMQDKHVAGLIDEWDRTDTDNLYLNLLMDAWHLYNNPLYKIEAIKIFQEIQADGVPILTPKNLSEMSLWLSGEFLTADGAGFIHDEFAKFDYHNKN